MEKFEAFRGLIVDINNCILEIEESEMRRLGLRGNHTLYLYHLLRHRDGLTATQLTELCGVDKAAVSRTLKQLQDKGLIYCELPENKRSYRTRLYLTDDGIKVATDVRTKIDQALSAGGLGLSRNAKADMYKILHRIRHNLNRYIDDLEDKSGK